MRRKEVVRHVTTGEEDSYTHEYEDCGAKFDDEGLMSYTHTRQCQSRDEAMATWRARNHGYGWELTKRRFRASQWTRKRCFWCRRARASSGKAWSTRAVFHHNHLWYGFSKEYRRWRPMWFFMGILRFVFGLRHWRTGQVPLFAFRLMCESCHDRETRWTRRFWPGARHGSGLFAHAFVTLGVRWSMTWIWWFGWWLAAVEVGLWS